MAAPAGDRQIIFSRGLSEQGKVVGVAQSVASYYCESDSSLPASPWMHISLLCILVHFFCFRKIFSPKNQCEREIKKVFKK